MTISYSPQKDLSNNVLYTPIGDHLTPALRGFVVKSQIPNLTLAFLLIITHAHKVYMNKEKELYASKLQDLFNGILGALFGVCLHFQPRFWTFKTPTRVQFPKRECIWESLGSIPCILPHLWKFVSHPNTLSWPHGPLHSAFNHKLNVKVATF